MPRTHLRPDLAFARTGPSAGLAATTAQKAGRGPSSACRCGVHRCRRPGFVFVLWQRGKLLVARWAPQPALSTVQVALRGSTTQATLLAQTAPQDAAPTATQLFQIRHSSAKDGARSRESGAKHRTAQGEPATNGVDIQKPLRSSRPARKRQSACSRRFRAEPARTSPPPTQPTPTCASPNGRFSPRTRERGSNPREWIDDEW